MKRYFIIFIFIALTCAGCRQDNAVQIQLMRIDTLLSNNQDEKAYEMLQALTDTATAADIAYYNLLKTRCLYKMNYEFENDSLIDAALQYYLTNGGEKSRLGEALYYKSEVSFLLGNMEDAILYAKKAETIAVDTKNYPLQNKVFLSLAYFNSQARDNDLAIEYTRKELYAASLCNNSQWIAYAILNLALYHNEGGNKDSASYYIDRLSDYLGEIDDNGKSFYYNCIGDLYKIDNPSLALKYYDSSLLYNTQPQAFKSQAELLVNSDDTAKIKSLCDKAMQNSWEELRIDALEIISDLYCKRNNAKSLKVVEDSITAELQKINQKLYHDKSVEKQQRYDAEISAIKFRQKIYIVLSLAVVAALIYAIIMIYFKLKKTKEESEATKLSLRIMDLQKQIADAQTDIEILNTQKMDASNNQDQLQGKIDAQKDKIEELQIKLDKYMSAHQHGKNLYDAIASGGNTALWTEDDYNSYYYYYMLMDSGVLDNYENTSGQQKFIIIQQSQGKTDKEIADVLAVSESTMRTYNSRIKRKAKAST